MFYVFVLCFSSRLKSWITNCFPQNQVRHCRHWSEEKRSCDSDRDSDVWQTAHIHSNQAGWKKQDREREGEREVEGRNWSFLEKWYMNSHHLTPLPLSLVSLLASIAPSIRSPSTSLSSRLSPWILHPALPLFPFLHSSPFRLSFSHHILSIPPVSHPSLSLLFLTVVTLKHPPLSLPQADLPRSMAGYLTGLLQEDSAIECESRGWEEEEGRKGWSGISWWKGVGTSRQQGQEGGGGRMGGIWLGERERKPGMGLRATQADWYCNPREREKEREGRNWAWAVMEKEETACIAKMFTVK